MELRVFIFRVTIESGLLLASFIVILLVMQLLLYFFPVGIRDLPVYWAQHDGFFSSSSLFIPLMESILFSFMIKHYLSSSLCRSLLITFCSSGLTIVNYFILCLSWNVFDISVDFFLKDNFARYSNLGWQLLTFTKLNSLDNTSRYISLLFFFLLMNITFTCLKVQESSLILHS